MELLDLPTEIFECVMAHYVNGEGIRRAWLRRRTFNDHIKTKVLAKQPASAYWNLGKRESAFLRNILRPFLEHRVVALYGANHVLPTHINKIVDVLVNVSGDTSPEKRSVWVRGVIGALIKTPNICKLAYNPSNKSRSRVMSSSGRQEALSVAVIMGKRDTVCALTTEQGAMWTKCSTGSELVCALDLAVQNDDLDLVEVLLSHTQRSTVSEVMKVQTVAVVRGITHAVRSNEPIALALLEWYISNAKHKEIRHLGDWFEEACASELMSFLGRLIALSTPTMRKEFRKRFLTIAEPCSNVYSRRHRFHPQLFRVLVSFLLDAGLFDRSNMNSSEWTERAHFHGLINTAVRRGDLNALERVMAASANSDRLRPDAKGLSTSLRHATQQCRFDICKLLIDHGANPDLNLGTQHPK
ncbi:uncharacterized protein J4E79_008103 [Alternaria viburni]|uniref:uncharacterized protein n=1 Tax=Alternaria viburni TaxID=566460 RepID=UPI0020C3BB47|nr:uncharacterized protein J4E79_008103 [Alternaria viburni]KAI4656547.1 hypothetical protein J4E79_008103 [Alternaria viburni]